MEKIALRRTLALLVKNHPGINKQPRSRRIACEGKPFVVALQFGGTGSRALRRLVHLVTTMQSAMLLCVSLPAVIHSTCQPAPLLPVRIHDENVSVLTVGKAVNNL